MCYAGTDWCGSVSWPDIDTVVVQGLPEQEGADLMHVQAGFSSNVLATVAQDQVFVSLIWALL